MLDTSEATARHSGRRLIVLIALLGALLPRASVGQQPEVKIRPHLAAMLVQAEKFDAQSLHAMGLAGLSAVLDHLLPDTAEEETFEAPEDNVAELIEQLGDERFRARELASEALLDLGPGIRPALLAATRSSDAEVRWRAICILRRWSSRNTEDKSRYVPAFAIFLAGISDRERLDELTRRTGLAFDIGMPSGGRMAVLQQCIMSIARTGKDEYTDRLRPLLGHEDVSVGVFVTQTVGSGSGHNFFPSLLIEALESPHKEIVRQAIARSADCWDVKRKEEVKRRLIAIFEGDDEALKFEACYPLMHDHNYAAAVDYLLTQVQSKDQPRATKAIGWIGDSSNHGRPAFEKLLKTLDPLLKSTDQNRRRAAARALAMYAGEEVVQRLIPLLGDSNSAVATEITYRLAHQKDKKMLQRLLAAAAKNDPNEKVRKKAAELAEKLDGS